MVFVQPEQSVADQEAPNFISTVIENKSIPIRLFSFSRVRVLVEVRPVEIAETHFILREMCGHPIQNHAEFRADGDSPQKT
jgi:hypothetical protein